MKIKKMREEAQMEAHLAVDQEYAPVLSTEPDRHERAGRASTGDLIRNSLSISTSGGWLERPVVDSPIRASPVKRPEDLE